MDLGSVPQFVTWRLADSIPASLIEEWENELRHEKDSQRKLEMYRRVEHYVDQGHGSCILKNPAAAQIVQAKLIEHHLLEYVLHEWVIMPNHVHVLLTPSADRMLGDTIGMLKGRTSRDINAMLGRSGRLWQPDYFDRFMREGRHFEGTARYIRRNPVKARLVQDEVLWAWSSANPVARERLESPISAG